MMLMKARRGRGEKDDVEGWGGDGILMNPHWLYEGLDLGVCCACAAYNDTSSSSSESIFWAPRQTDTDTLTQTDAEKDKEKKDVKEKGEGVKLNRCGRCGTAAYCSPACQRRDWAVHKAVCGLPLLERGKMLKIVEKVGLDQGGIRGHYLCRERCSLQTMAFGTHWDGTWSRWKISWNERH
jgi:hypothetical protein